MLKIISWNIRQGGGQRVAQICKELVESRADIIHLSEYRNNASGIQIRTNLLRAGYRYQHVGQAARDDNSTAIFSKIPSDAYHHPSGDPVYQHNIISNKFDAFVLYGMYLPHKKKHTLFDYLLDVLSEDVPAILVGDFNTGINGVDQKGSSFWYTDKLIALGKQGYKDAFRIIHGDVREYSWYSHQGNGYRYDHTYIHEDLIPVIRSCYYLHEWRENKLSDHSPMVIELGQVS